MQFFAGICTHMFQKCSVIHKSFVLCRSFDDALVLFRAALVEDTNTTGDDSIGNGRVDVAPTAGSEKDAVTGKEEASITDDGEVSESCMEWNFATAQMESVTHVKYRVRQIVQWTHRDERGDWHLCRIYDSSKQDNDKCHQRTVHELDLLPSTITEFNRSTDKNSRSDRAKVKIDDSAPATGTATSQKKRKKAKRDHSTKEQLGVDSPEIDFNGFQTRQEALASVLEDDDAVVVAVGPYALRDDLANLAKSKNVATATLAGWHEMREAQHFRCLLARQKVLTSQYLRRAMCFGVVGTSAFFSGKIFRFHLHDRSPPVVNHCSM